MIPMATKASKARDFGFQYALSKQFGVEYWAMSCSDSLWFSGLSVNVWAAIVNLSKARSNILPQMVVSCKSIFKPKIQAMTNPWLSWRPWMWSSDFLQKFLINNGFIEKCLIKSKSNLLLQSTEKKPKLSAMKSKKWDWLLKRYYPRWVWKVPFRVWHLI